MVRILSHTDLNFFQNLAFVQENDIPKVWLSIHNISHSAIEVGIANFAWAKKNVSSTSVMNHFFNLGIKISIRSRQSLKKARKISKNAVLLHVRVLHVQINIAMVTAALNCYVLPQREMSAYSLLCCSKIVFSQRLFSIMSHNR